MRSKKRTEIHLDNFEIINDPFQNVFCLFNLSGLFENRSTKFKENNILRSAVITAKIIFNVFIFLHFSLTTTSYILSMKDNLKLKIAYLFMDLLSILNRIYLQKNFKQLKNLAKVACEHGCFKVRKNILKRVLITVWSITTNALLLIAFSLEANVEEITKRTLFGYECKSVFFTYLQSFLYVCCTGILFYIPFNTFIIYYTMLCYEIRNMILDYMNEMKSTVTINYDRLNEGYCRITSRVKFIDSKVGIFIFISFLLNGCMMYTTIVSILHTSFLKQYGTVVLTVKILCGVMILLNFTVQLFCASSVHHASLLVRDEAAAIKENNPKFVSSYLSFVLTHQEEICMTVWGIARINKSFIFGTFGTVLTYCFMFDSIKTTNK